MRVYVTSSKWRSGDRKSKKAIVCELLSATKACRVIAAESSHPGDLIKAVVRFAGTQEIFNSPHKRSFSTMEGIGVLIHVTPQQHVAAYNSLSDQGRMVVHSYYPETMQMPRSEYLLHIPEEMGRTCGEQLSQADADALVGIWPELNYFLEPMVEPQ